VSAILAAGGRGVRFGANQPKQLLQLGGRAILQRCLDAFLQSDRVDDIVVALPPELVAAPPDYLRTALKPVHIVAGGERRQDSVANAFALVRNRADIIVIHDAARPFVSPSLIARTIDAAVADGAAIAALAARDTVKRRDADGMIADTLPREEIFLAQTPQAFRTDVLRDALSLNSASSDATDEAMLAEQAGHRVRLVEGDPRNLKITTPDDLEMAEALAGGVAVRRLRIGNGYDLHRLVAGRALILGGVMIPFEKGLDGHSDADAVCHAITDAILGAAGAGDIGRHFPDDDPVWKNANSLELLRRAWLMARNAGFRLVNVDVVVIAEKPKLSPYADQMIANLAAVLESGRDQISIKGKTNEGVDSTGAGESIAVHAVALLSRAFSPA
jgi:2-C-methyl-D-erythritol 4-phosphate cytidylyltransferase/2-C-methyl-D-erythritol 2,4-cyclodiphosphate synthase